MEKSVEKIMKTVNNTERVTGCLLADQSGLCYAAKGIASPDSAGLIAAIANQVAKLEPEGEAPVIRLQNNLRQCLIQRQDTVVAAIYQYEP